MEPDRLLEIACLVIARCWVNLVNASGAGALRPLMKLAELTAGGAREQASEGMSKHMIKHMSKHK